MLKFMQRRAKYFYIFFFLIIISFIFFYIGPTDQKSAIALIEIGDKKVYPEVYWKTYEGMRNNYANMFKDGFNAEMEKKMNIKQQALDFLVESELLLVAAKRFNLAVSLDELTRAITSEPNFSKDGVFNKEIYLRILQANQMTAGYYENRRREELLVEKTKRFIELAATAQVSIPPDLQEKFKDNEQIMQSIRQSKVQEAKSKVLKAYIEGLKKTVPIKIRSELIA
ncbi:MAG: SurA N-terminal domain-containing protein [Nitrospirae bacterium]|uniref:SurA N-terminal domain-containing protein n=1 Tax=Candidatus Magnetobacterium casense TaxID=1455061 RepID=UPI00058DBA80|nr:SurA N-terminal domain-containing protein [Candidatus Magnetobacterium casensis]MBF0339115.1 SurA N-terminal domain-containing protein [Nitrospirota bacterium]